MNSSQFNNKQEEHNCIMTLIKPIEPPCAKPNKLAGHCLYEGDHPPLGLNMNMESSQRQVETPGSLSTDIRLNRKLVQRIQLTEQAESQSVGQLTLRAMERSAWCTNERGNPRVVIFGLEIRGQDEEVTQRVLTQATKTAARSGVCLLIDKG